MIKSGNSQTIAYKEGVKAMSKSIRCGFRGVVAVLAAVLMLCYVPFAASHAAEADDCRYMRWTFHSVPSFQPEALFEVMLRIWTCDVCVPPV